MQSQACFQTKQEGLQFLNPKSANASGKDEQEAINHYKCCSTRWKSVQPPALFDASFIKSEQGAPKQGSQASCVAYLRCTLSNLQQHVNIVYCSNCVFHIALTHSYC